MRSTDMLSEEALRAGRATVISRDLGALRAWVAEHELDVNVDALCATIERCDPRQAVKLFDQVFVCYDAWGRKLAVLALRGCAVLVLLVALGVAVIVADAALRALGWVS